MGTAFIFSGQGAQKPGMGKELYDASAAAREVFSQVNGASRRDIAALCFEGTQEELNDTANTQLCMLAVDLAAYAALREAGVAPAYTAGFSLGEYAALVCAGVLTVAQAAELVSFRAKYMAEAARGKMAAVIGLSPSEVEAACAEVTSGKVWPANYNTPAQTVVSGEDAAVDELIALLKAKRVRAIPLRVSGAFHSEIMLPAAEKLIPHLKATSFVQEKIPLVLNLTGQVRKPEEDFADVLAKQCVSPVLWEKSVRTLIALGADVFVECGPGGVLSGFLRQICPEIPLYAVENKETLAAAVAALANK